jgi:hypothetical protein
VPNAARTASQRQFEHPCLQRGGFYDLFDRVAVHFEIEKAALKFYFCVGRVDGSNGVF